MADLEKMRAALADHAKDRSHRFNDVVKYLSATGWKLRIKGSHHMFTRTGLIGFINIQPEKDGKAKGYQVAQIRKVLEMLGL